jgi:competence protein ComEA
VSTPGPIRCHVVGPVNLPGVYILSPGSRVQDALQAAGGPTVEADLEQLNLAAVVQDQDQIIVPRHTMGLAPGSSSSVQGSSTDLVNVNTADNETLQTLPGIGPVLAGRIIDYRNTHGPFGTIDSLVEVKGIGAATLEKLRPLITLGP